MTSRTKDQMHYENRKNSNKKNTTKNTDKRNMDNEPTRLNKYLSEAGICSRREADRLIEQGKVTVDGKPAVTGMRVTGTQTIKVGKKSINQKDEMVLLAVNKPAGVICTEEKKVRNNIINYLKYPTRITYVGRLDKESEGLLLMTNNGDITNKIMRAGNYHEKEYKVTVNKVVTKEFLEQMASGVRIKKVENNVVMMDEVTRPCTVERIGKYKFGIILTQGLNRQIRRMCETLGYEVTKLERTRIMNIELGSLKPGAYRKVTNHELALLNQQLGNTLK